MPNLCYRCRKFDKAKKFTQPCQQRGGVCEFEERKDHGAYYASDYYKPALPHPKHLRFPDGFKLDSLKV
jgi:hypothetical protein